MILEQAMVRVTQPLCFQYAHRPGMTQADRCLLHALACGTYVVYEVTRCVSVCVESLGVSRRSFVHRSGHADADQTSSHGMTATN